MFFVLTDSRPVPYRCISNWKHCNCYASNAEDGH